MSKLGIVVQARIGSTRLPRKMILPFYKKMGILETLLRRLRFELSIPVIVATTIKQNDDEIEIIAKRCDCDIFRGSEDNVLERFIGAANAFKIDKIIRICADNPFLDINALKGLIIQFGRKDVDYLCFSLSTGKPTILTHYGFWAEGVSLKALKSVQSCTAEKIYKEHVTNYIYTHENEFRIEKIVIDERIENAEIRLTIDTEEDFKLSRSVFEFLDLNKIEFKAEEIVKILLKQKNWLLQMTKQIKENAK